MAWSRMPILENLRIPNICCLPSLKSKILTVQFSSSVGRRNPTSHDTQFLADLPSSMERQGLRLLPSVEALQVNDTS